MSAISLLRQLARTRWFTLGVPGHFSLSPDGMRLLFLRSLSGDDPHACLWELDVVTGTERLLATGAGDSIPAEERVRRERARIWGSGIVSYHADSELKKAVFALSGELWLVDIAAGSISNLPSAGDAVDPRLDPTGRRIAYVSGGGLRVISCDGEDDRVIAEPDGPEVTYGLAEHVAMESMDRHRGYWWSPDGERLLVSRVDNAPVNVWWISDPADPGAAPTAVRYPIAGTANAEVTLGIFSFAGDRVTVEWDRKSFEYVTAAGWDGHGPFACVQTRDQGTVQLLGIDPANGTTTLLDERRDECWVDLTPGLPARTGEGEWVWHRDLGDTRHLTVGGKAVTPPGLQIRALLSVDPILFQGSAEPTEVHVYRYTAEGLEQLTDQPGVHNGLSCGDTLLTTSRYPDVTTVTRPGRSGITIASHPEQPVLPLRRISLSAGPRGLRSHLFLPSWHEAGQLPVLMNPYGGSAAQMVTAVAQFPPALVSQWFAEQGFAVLVVDGSGTPGRGPVWEREVHGDVYTSVLGDQIAALAETARLHSELDLSRVAIRGWSYGGSLAALAVLRHPEVFHAAIAGASVTDERLYDTHWQERFLGHPDVHPERYDANSLILAAPSLTRPLLLIHGLADDNVYPVNTLRFSSALLAAGRPHEVLPLSGVTHMATPENLLLHELDFLRRSLPQG